MKRVCLLIPALFFIFAAGAQAHGPVRAKLFATVKIKAPADKVWAVIKDYGDMSWHPAIASTTIKKVTNKAKKKVDVRTLTLKSGGTISEELKSFSDKKMSYKYKIVDMSVVKTIQHSGQKEDIPVLPVATYSAKLTVKGKGDSSEVEWIAYYYRGYLNNNPPAELNEAAADKAVTAVLKSGLAGLLAKFQPGAKDSAVKIKLER